MSMSIRLRSLFSLMHNKKLSINIDDLTTYIPNKYDYDIFCEGTINYLLDDYSSCNDIVEIIINNKNGQKVIHRTLMQFLINVYFLEFHFMYHIPITEKFLYEVDHHFLSNYSKNVEKMAHDILPYINEKGLSQAQCYSFLFYNLTYRLTRLCELFSIISGPTISLIDIIEFSRRNSEFNHIINTTLDDTKTYSKLEAQLKRDGDRLYEIIIEDKNSCLYPFAVSDCLKKPQLTQMFVAVGPRMTTSNIVMNHIMKKSYLNGLQNAGDFICEAEIANKALIYKKKFVGISGYMSRETDLVAGGIYIDLTMKDCGTKHYVNYEVTNARRLKFICGKNIVMPDGKLRNVSTNDTDLIGKTVKLRSVTTCAHHDPHKVCMACYGTVYDFKKKVDIGGLTSTEVNNVLSNAVMSVKHHSETNTVEFNDPEMLKIFNVQNDTLILKHLENAETISLIFDKEYVEDVIERVNNGEDFDTDIVNDDTDEDIEDDSEESQAVFNSKMIENLRIVTKCIDPDTKEEVDKEYELHLDNHFLVFNEAMLNNSILKEIDCPMDSDEAILNLASVKPGTGIFTIKYITKETSKYLKQMKSIIERPKPRWYDNDIDTAISDFTNLIAEAGLKNAEMVHIEPILRKIMKCKDDPLKYPDFSKDKVDYYITNLKYAIFKGNLESALSFEQLTNLFKDIDSFRERVDGPHDAQFRTSTKHDLKYMKKALKKIKAI